MVGPGAPRGAVAERVHRTLVAAQVAARHHGRARHACRRHLCGPGHASLCREGENSHRCPQDEHRRRRERVAGPANQSGATRKRDAGPDLPEPGHQGRRQARSRQRTRIQSALAPSFTLAAAPVVSRDRARPARLDTGTMAHGAVRGGRLRRAPTADPGGSRAAGEARRRRQGPVVPLGAYRGTLPRHRGHREVTGSEARRRAREHPCRSLPAGAARSEVRGHPAGRRLAQRSGPGSSPAGRGVRAGGRGVPSGARPDRGQGHDRHRAAGIGDQHATHPGADEDRGGPARGCGRSALS